MQRIHTVVIGGGQAGLAMSRCLTDRDIDHVVLERGRLGERWRSERWDSLRLLTPNWMTRLPGWHYRGNEPDGFMSMPEVVGFIEGYGRSFGAPVETQTTVQAVERLGALYRVTTNRGCWEAHSVVIATGHCDIPFIPALAQRLPADIQQIVPSHYKNPEELSEGGVLIVGASSTGVQLADELHRSGRPVTLAVGSHTRLPRRYRGRDIMWWLDKTGLLDETADEVRDLESARRQPSLQLVGRPNHDSIDLAQLRNQGVRIVGRAIDLEAGRMRFAADLIETTAAADRKLLRLLARIERFVRDGSMSGEFDDPEPIVPITLEPSATAIDLKAAGITTVVWATGYSRRYPWLKVPVLDDRGEIRHHSGITPSPGLYVLGLRFLRRRKSNFIDGVGQDAEDLADRFCQQLVKHRRVAA
jgi:putative flavoprotein involved in K+ transport